MSDEAGLADLNLVLARILPDDDLHERARHRVAEADTLVVPFPVGLELLFVAHRWGLGRVEALGAADAHFDVERADVLYTAAEALDAGEISTVFDAVHCAEALHRDTPLVTADESLHGAPYPTEAF